ncbi:MAG: hypothetical protein Kow0047_09880 [Anaerolineae bacterium]
MESLRMKPISIMWSAGVTEEEARLAIKTIQEQVEALFSGNEKPRRPRNIVPVLPVVRPLGTWYIPDLPQGAPYWGTQWYIERTLHPELGRIRGPEFLRLVQLEPWQNHAPHFDMALVEYEVMEDPDDSPHLTTLGMTLPGTATVVSVAPLRLIHDPLDRERALRRLIIHQLGHLARVPRPGRTKNVTLATGEPHCTALCAMRDARNVFELVRYAKEEAEAGVTLCPDCENDLRVQLISAQFSLN